MFVIISITNNNIPIFIGATWPTMIEIVAYLELVKSEQFKDALIDNAKSLIIVDCLNPSNSVRYDRADKGDLV